jgi:peptidoglycan/LPS O-acetylase OafA/YrhL
MANPWEPTSAAIAQVDGYRSDIDGLRAIAVLAVLFYHAGFRGFHGGLTGVDIFFVLSGFLIGGHIHTEESAGRFSFVSFYRRRAKRILPALYVVICAALFVGIWFLSPRELQRTATEAIAALLSVSNIFYWKVADYFAVASDQRVLLMTWSLGVEEQFYLVVPLLMIGLMRRRLPLRRVLLALTLLSAGIAWYQVAHTPTWAFYLLPARAWELLSGVLVAVYGWQKRWPGSRSQHMRGAAGLLCLLLPISFLTPSVPFPVPGAIPSVLGTVLVLSSPASWTNRSILSLQPLRFIGKISYSLYLWHWPLLTLMRIVVGTNPSALQASLVLGLAFLCAVASYYWVEQPFRRSGTASPGLFLRYGVLTALLISVCLAFKMTYGLAFRAPALAQEERLVTVKKDPCIVEAFVSRPNLSNGCVENTGRPALLLWGDSHAEALGQALRDTAHSAGYDFILMSKSSCPPLVDAGRFLRDGPGYAQECIAFNRAIVSYIQRDRSIQAVVLAADWRAPLVDPYVKNNGWLVTADAPNAPRPDIEASRRIFGNSLQHTLALLTGSGKHVLLLQDVPVFQIEPLWRVRTAALPLRRWLYSRLRTGGAIDPPVDPGVDAESDRSADAISREIVANARKNGVDLVDLEKALCDSPFACRYRDGTHLFYEDVQHVSDAGADAALRGLSISGAKD